MRGKVEEEQGVQGQRDGHVVDEGGVQVALAGGPVAVVVQVESLVIHGSGLIQVQTKEILISKSDLQEFLNMKVSFRIKYRLRFYFM